MHQATLVQAVRPHLTDRADLPQGAADSLLLGVGSLLATRRLPRWAGAALLVVYVGFVAGGFVLYGAATTGT